MSLLNYFFIRYALVDKIFIPKIAMPFWTATVIKGLIHSCLMHPKRPGYLGDIPLTKASLGKYLKEKSYFESPHNSPLNSL